MKRNIAVLAIIISLVFAGDLYARKFTLKPEKPKPSDKVTVTFDPAGSPLEKADKIEMYSYFYTKDLRETNSTSMKKKGKVWTATFTSSDEDLGAVIVFRNDDMEDHNDKRGYVVHFHDKSGEVLPGSYAGLGYAYFSWGAYYLGFDRNPVLASEMMEKDFVKNPALKESYVKYYTPVAATISKERSIDILKEGIAVLEKKNSPDEDDYSTLVEYYKRLSDQESAAKYEQIAIEKYPDGAAAQMKEASEIAAITDINLKINAVKEYGKKYPDNRFLPGLQNQIIKAYIEAKDFISLKNFLLDNKDGMNPFFYHDTAEKILDAGGNAEIALEIASAGFDADAADKKKKDKPSFYSELDWKKSQENTTGQILFSRGRALYELERKKEALNDFEKAAGLMEYKEPEVNLYLTKALMDEGKYQKAYEKVSEFISNGNSSEEIDKLFEEIYVKTKGSDKGYNDYAAALTKKSYKKLALQLETEMINETAPVFKLTDLQGKEVSLEQYKGKVVILDFWATWCGPCLQSFPGLQRSVDKYRTNDNVKFLFINTWERVEDRKKNAEDFMAKNSYSFDVLLDLENKVVEQYKVSGIPTKFIIDKKGNIRFKSVGFSGSPDKMITEIDVMISMLE
jgi:thiol-disulfide isomerase/thioredoxin